MSVCLRTKWLWVQILLLSLKSLVLVSSFCSRSIVLKISFNRWKFQIFQIHVVGYSVGEWWSNIWQHSVHWGINPHPPQKHHPRLSCQAPLKSANCPSLPFLGNLSPPPSPPHFEKLNLSVNPKNIKVFHP